MNPRKLLYWLTPLAIAAAPVAGAADAQTPMATYCAILSGTTVRCAGLPRIQSVDDLYSSGWRVVSSVPAGSLAYLFVERLPPPTEGTPKGGA